MKLNVDKKATQAQIEKIVNNEELSKSAKMKQLFDLGLEVKEIANIMQVRYNFVYNVVSNYVVTSSLEVVKEKKDSKKDKIIELYRQGRSLKEIQIELKTNYNYVHNVIKEVKERDAQ